MLPGPPEGTAAEVTTGGQKVAAHLVSSRPPASWHTLTTSGENPVVDAAHSALCDAEQLHDTA
jgi:hypothetical protein